MGIPMGDSYCSSSAPVPPGAALPLLLPEGFDPAKHSGNKSGVGKESCPRTIIAWHVCPKSAVKTILKDGFKPGSDPHRCRIGKGIYFFANRECAIKYAKRPDVKGKILTTALHTKKEIFDTGEKSYYKASWLWGHVGIALGRHYPAMAQQHHFNELLKANPKSTTVLFVGKKKAQLPAGSLFKKTHDKIFSKKFHIKHMKLQCGAHVSYI